MSDAKNHRALVLNFHDHVLCNACGTVTTAQVRLAAPGSECHHPDERYPSV